MTREELEAALGLEQKVLIDQVTSRIVSFYGSRLVSFAIFGSYARGEARLDSDLDLLIIVEPFLRRLKEVRSFIENVEFPLEESLRSLNLQDIRVQLSPLILGVAQASKFNPLYLEMVENSVILYDPKNLLKNILHQTRMKMKKWGSQKIMIGHQSVWQIRSNPKWNEDFDYDN